MPETKPLETDVDFTDETIADFMRNPVLTRDFNPAYPIGIVNRIFRDEGVLMVDYEVDENARSLLVGDETVGSGWLRSTGELVQVSLVSQPAVPAD